MNPADLMRRLTARKPAPRVITCPTCADTHRYLWTRTTPSGNTIVDHYGDCPDCTTAVAA